ncbi:short-chain dehydrogenase/reductase (SDR) family protein [Tieghemostelium lacteum]|uniref:Short-chain dehydrogenase/reductase (SDR) family protein n=1 Tax=Tieghemostelium lacteum TaxID=361077 RepID=A0A151ZIH3_TIELA|nr:short-chain dehydrogenase/reductase (SDR) family protein [Tieghemostelium lacteum]|eukprot:KYQ93801.1 short-chain dehydrogenase/reductase (SDR) family protein [Tieghemostelium lacteum]
MSGKVWIITGATSGTGLALAQKLVEKGDKVVGTSRNINKWKDLDISKHENFLGIQVDITSEKSIQEGINQALGKFGTIDVLVNNAGQGLVGSIEEITDKEHRDLFDALYFGPLNLIRAVLPIFRAKKSGYIFNVSSVAGVKSYPRFGAYNGAKFALLGMSGSLADDVKPFGIKTTCIVLGYFKTGSQTAYENAKELIPQYDTINFWKALTDHIKTLLVPGDVNRFADIVIETEQSENPPTELYLGPDAFATAESRIQEIQKFVDEQKIKNSDVSLKDWDKNVSLFKEFN